MRGAPREAVRPLNRRARHRPCAGTGRRIKGLRRIGFVSQFSHSAPDGARGHPAQPPELGQGPVQRPLQPALVARQTIKAPRRLPVLVQRPRQGRILRDLQVDRQGQGKPFVPVLALVPGQGEQVRGDAFMVRRRLHLVPLGQ